MDAVRVETRPEVQTTVATTLLGRPAIWTDLTAVFWAGLISGAVYLLFMMIFQPIFVGINGWLAMRQYAAMMGGPQYLAPSTFNLGLLILSIIMVCSMSIIITYFGVSLVRPTSIQASLVGGLVLGTAFYLVNYYMWSGLFPWFANFRNWVNGIDHAIVGLLAGILYWSFHNNIERNRGDVRDVRVAR